MGASSTTWACTDAPVRGSWVMRGGSERSRRPRPARVLNRRPRAQQRSPRRVQPRRAGGGGGLPRAPALGPARGVGGEALVLGAQEQLRVTVVFGKPVAALGQE